MLCGEIRPVGAGKRKPQWVERKPGHKHVTTLNGKKGGAAGMTVLMEAEGQSPKVEEGLALKPAPSSLCDAFCQGREGTHCLCWAQSTRPNLGLCVCGREVFVPVSGGGARATAPQCDCYNVPGIKATKCYPSGFRNPRQICIHPVTSRLLSSMPSLDALGQVSSSYH